MGRLRGDQFHSITEEFVGGEHGVVGEGIHLVRVTLPPPSTQLIPTSHEKKLLAAVGHWRGRLLRVAGDRANDGWRLTCDPQRNQCLVKKKTCRRPTADTALFLRIGSQNGMRLGDFSLGEHFIKM